MKIHTNLAELPKFRNAVLTIGSYDCVHAGHQAIIKRINELARQIDGESVLITFYPHPRIVLRPDDKSLQLLNSIEEKTVLLEKYGINHLVIVPFTEAFAAQTPEEYIKDFLVNKFYPKQIVIGYDHRFGKKRAGDINLLKHYADELGYEVLEIEKQEVDTMVVSSTKVRNALLDGNISHANELLNHVFSLTGTVVHGKQIGRTIGFPTANIAINTPYKLIPPMGIYAVRVIHGGQRYGGMLYIGNRPTLNGAFASIEVHIFDFDKMIYGDMIIVEFVAKTRDDKKFDGLESLKAQLAKDEIAVKQVLKVKN